MSDFTTVYFKCLDRAFYVPAVLADFSIFGLRITIHTYGAIIAFGFLLAVLLGGRIAYTWKMSLDKMIDVLIYGTIAAIIGARLYYVFSKWDYYGQNPSEIFKIWEGGLAIYGGIICGVLAAFIVSKVRKMNFLNLLDCVSISLLVGQGIGRWGNYANQEAFGVNTDLPWGMYSEKTKEYLTTHLYELSQKGMDVDPSGYVHPTFLYESIWCLLGVLVLYIVCRKFRKFSGQMALLYGFWYGTERAVVEGLRTDSLYIGSTNIRTSQVLSIVIAAVCLVLFIVFTIRAIKHPKPVDGVDYFLEEKLLAEKEGKADNDGEKEEAAESAEAEETSAEETDDEGAVYDSVFDSKEEAAEAPAAAEEASAEEPATEETVAEEPAAEEPAAEEENKSEEE